MRAILAALLCLCIGAASADVLEPIGKSTRYTARRGTSNMQSPQPTSIEQCRARVEAAIQAEGETRTSGSITYQCITTESWMVHFRPAPVSLPPLPAPANLRTTSVNERLVRVQWDAVTGAQSYDLQFCRGIECTNLAPLSCVRATTYDHTLPLSATARYKVAASRATDCSNPGAQTGYVVGTTVPPPPPTCPDAPAPQTRTINCPAGTTGTYTEQSSSAVSAPPECIVTTTWTAIPPGNGACVPVSQPPLSALFSDRFEYDIPRTGDADAFRQRGYVHVKAENSRTNSGGSGYIYTRFDEALGSRVLVLESRPTMRPPPGDFPYSQTDYYLQLGQETGSGVAIPANAWIQFWTYATPESRFSTRDKAIYPCRGSYPCTNLTWLFMWGSGGFEGVSAPAGGRYLALEGWGADRDTRVNDGDERKLYQNASRTPLLAGRWYQVRLHVDISTAQGTYEAWIREIGATSWLKVADWRSGVTPNFSWPISNRNPHSIARVPTTVNQSDNTVYIDDLVIGRSQSELPAN